MTISNAQRHDLMGAAVYVRRDPKAGVYTPFLDLGTIKTVTPNVSEEVMQIKDGRTGDLELKFQRTKKRPESWQFVIQNLNQENLRYLFQATSPTPVSISGDTYWGQKHVGHPGHRLLLGAFGNDFGVAAQTFPRAHHVRESDVLTSTSYTNLGPRISIFDFSLEAPLAMETLTGSVDTTASVNVVGVGTAFTTELTVGDWILVGSQRRRVVSISDNTHLAVNVAFTDQANDTTPQRFPTVIQVDAGDEDLTDWVGRKIVLRDSAKALKGYDFTVTDVTDDGGGLWTIEFTYPALGITLLGNLLPVISQDIFGADSSACLQLEQDTDWEWVSPAQGVVRLLNDTAYPFADTAPVDLYVDFEATATMSRMLPGAEKDTVTGDVEIWLADNDNETRDLREFRACIKSEGATLGVEDFNEVTLKFDVRAKRGDANKFGTWKQVVGSFPSLS